MSLQHWETYYRHGALATCPTNADGGYDKEIHQAWADFFATCPEGAHILDIGTGNGAVALIAADTGQSLDRHWEIHASDLALIDPMRDVPDAGTRMSGIRFHPSVAAENLPFETGSFDAVSGQYALEYTQMNATLEQVFRVLKPGGIAQFIIHHHESPILRNAALSLAEIDFVLKESKIYRHLKRLTSAEDASPRIAQQTGNDLRLAIQSLKRALTEAVPRGEGKIFHVTLDAVQKLLQLRTQYTPLFTGKEVDRAEQDLRALGRRLNDLINSAKDEAGMQLLERTALDAGLSVTERVVQLHDGDNIIGWRLVLRRP